MSCKTPLSDIGQFYKQIDDFRNKIINILNQLKEKNITDCNGKIIDIDHEIKEINKYYDKLILVKKANVRKPIELLYQYGVASYAKEILLRDEQFFLGEVNSLTDSDKNAADPNLNQKDLFFIAQIRLVWDHLYHVTNVKNNIWSYVQVICLLAEKITGGNHLSGEKMRLKQIGHIL